VKPRLGRTLDRLVRRRNGRGLILLYHRVAALEIDPQLLCVEPTRFAEHLEVLGDLTTPVPLSRIRDASAEAGPVPVVVTFDDGYADNLVSAAPMLKARRIPATIFVVSGLVGADREFWWDELERALLVENEVPSSLELQLDGDVVRFGLGDGRIGDPRWNVLDETVPSPRQAAYRVLARRLSGLDPLVRNGVIDELRRWAGISGGARATHRVLDEGGLRRLDALELVEVGAHTMSHPSLGMLSRERQRDEIRGSKRRLEDLLGQRISSFSYPFGGSADYSQETVRAVAEAKFEFACINVEGRVGPNTDHLRLPRVIVRNWDRGEFERRLHGWMAASRLPQG